MPRAGGVVLGARALTLLNAIAMRRALLYAFTYTVCNHIRHGFYYRVLEERRIPQ